MSGLERVVVFHDISEAQGGASFLVRLLIDELRRMGISTTFVTGDDGSAFGRDDVELVSVGGTHIARQSAARSLVTGLRNPDTVPLVRRWIAANDTPGTVYHLHGWSKILSPTIFTALAPVKARLVLHAHDYFNGCPNGAFFVFPQERDCPHVPLSAGCVTTRCDKASYGHKLWRVTREALRRRLDRQGGPAARVLTLHPGMNALLARAGLPADRIHAVRNPVTPFTTERVPAEANRGVVFVGRISREKGADLAARAAARAGVPITFVGEGADMDAVRAQNPDARFTGWLDRAAIAAEIASARVAVMPSRWSEPFGLVALEAIGSGVPAVVNRTALLAPELEAAGFGRAVDTRDEAAFAHALARLAHDDAMVERMSRAGREGYLSLCNTVCGWAEGVIGHYRAVLDAAAPHGTGDGAQAAERRTNG
jgi:glycosyltransferase involved in cell wall biosynthesis